MCGADFTSMYSLDYHHKTRHVEPQHLCTYCGRKFAFDKLLQRHIAEKHEAGKHDPHACEVCGKKFLTHRVLLGHMRIVHGEDKFKCKLCDAKFKTLSTLTRHQYSHSKQRPYGCHLCTTGYYRSDYLKGHYESAHQITLTSEEVLTLCVRTKISKELVE